MKPPKKIFIWPDENDPQKGHWIDAAIKPDDGTGQAYYSDSQLGEVVDVLLDVTSELEGEIKSRVLKTSLKYPDERQKYDLDMDIVHRARALAERILSGKT